MQAEIIFYFFSVYAIFAYSLLFFIYLLIRINKSLRVSLAVAKLTVYHQLPLVTTSYHYIQLFTTICQTPNPHTLHPFTRNGQKGLDPLSSIVYQRPFLPEADNNGLETTIYHYLQLCTTIYHYQPRFTAIDHTHPPNS